MPSLTTVTLDKKYAFKCKKTVHVKSPSFSSPLFLDITPALQYYLQFIVSFTPYSSHVHHQLIQQENKTTSHNHSTPAFLTNQPHPSFLPSHTPLPFTASHPHPPLHPTLHPFPQTPHCTSTHTQNPNKQERGTTHTPSPPSHFLPILDVGPRNHSSHTLEVHFRTMEMFKTAVYSVECLKEKPIASPVVGTVIHHITHRM